VQNQNFKFITKINAMHKRLAGNVDFCRKLKQFKMRNSIFIGVIVLGLFISSQTSASVVTQEASIIAEPNNTKQTWQNVISALKEIQNLASGRGSALVTNIERGQKRSCIMEFEFKGNLSRTTRYFADPFGKKLEKEMTLVQGKGFCVKYFREKTIIEELLPNNGYLRNIGFDFHPDTFINWMHYGVVGPLTAFYYGHYNWSAKKDSNDIINLTSSYKDVNNIAYYSFSFDAKKGYRPVQVYEDVQYLTINKLGYKSALEWAKYSSEWYIKSANVEVWSTVYPSGETRKGTVELTIQNFEPNISIDDNDFTIEALEIPKGTLVVNKINNREYIYGSEEPNKN